MKHELPLQGKKVLVTRNKSQAQSFGRKVEGLGGEAVLTSLISFRPALSPEQAPLFQVALDDADWLVFTSVNGAKFFFSYLEDHGMSLPAASKAKVAAVGEKTARYLRDRDLPVDLMPDVYVAEQLAEALKQKVSRDDKVAVLKGNLSRDVIQKTLSPLGIDISEWTLYETVPDQRGIHELKEAAARKSFDFVTFTSSSTVHTFMDILKAESKIWAEKGHTVFISIGPLTKKALQEYGIFSYMPSVYTIDGMLETMCRISRKGE
ncbi:uroporphyrinogen-III synthase [Bacillus swezeyi]|uniref:uroporphyrinogen-III synthase n=1 Tax=Bacillus swezeyi TaxID=1925020 RepID=UPI00123B846C|nr:uroporphyrinogen-III synthase [Bacillus swezeyi]KAA6481831.1 uroporphyrinogen-III synthase [Bacillus swezeyi]